VEKSDDYTEKKMKKYEGNMQEPCDSIEQQSL
jgi:hypothetical protein